MLAVTGAKHVAATDSGLPRPQTLTDWEEHLSYWGTVRQSLEQLQDSAYQAPLDDLVEQLAPLGEGLGARLSAGLTDSSYRTARRTAKSLLKPDVDIRAPALLDVFRDALAVRRRCEELGQTGAPKFPADLDALTTDHAALATALRELEELVGQPPNGAERSHLEEYLEALRADFSTLERMPDIHQLRRDLDECGLHDLVACLAEAHAGTSESTTAFDACLARSIVDHIRDFDSRVRAFEGSLHSSRAEQFQLADKKHIETTASRVRRAAAVRALGVGDQHPEADRRIRHESGKKSRHRPLRKLFDASPEVMTAIKPCWVMSPLVVSQVLPNDRPYFDVVIFDEASQVRPAEAIPSIARGRRLVVAGDEKQLPPTSFFAGGDLDSDDTYEDEAPSAAESGFESILDALIAQVEWRSLDWHYRSEDERLIAFSNTHLYGRSLVTFPGASGPECLQHIKVPWAASHAAGEDGSNAEVLRVVDLILEHAEKRPHETLGVIALGIKHADRVDAELRRVLATRNDLDSYFDESQTERFFVKNLERVQGDERDAIILTVGYGRSPEGRMMYRFGPLNNDGGERRLNVAITRARRRMTVVSSFSATDMDAERTKARGADLLRRYIEYAESGGSRLDGAESGAVPLNAFELDVRDALEQAGVPVVCQHGVSGYRLDFAAKHPTEPGRFVLAIEADGASYHSAYTARDRDRLRQEHLERLGWTFHRIWSQDWFSNRAREIEKVVQAYAAAVEACDAQDAVPSSPAPSAEPAHASPAIAPERGKRPAVYAGGKIDEYSSRSLEAMVRWIESDTLLRTRDEVVSEVMSELGFRRRGSKIVARIEAAIDRVRANPT